MARFAGGPTFGNVHPSRWSATNSLGISGGWPTSSCRLPPWKSDSRVVGRNCLGSRRSPVDWVSG